VEDIRFWQNQIIEELENLTVESPSPIARRH